ncbi:putative zinc-type alcohol dehydrogenase-like protein [Lachnellula hyalina]|uniref:Putative zinc-type alcohol dehydrogenase-like protein n=1 Tax=Lachnellula hyalina TaxID=1316788 RepID=A0A8H8QVK2_9HELO|nr:putative zinc-type alcohol dehydrogenase-like protein [Lachnellula hyalina]TVY22940.1 putative zinc-type alcohol dehydrogenase-like protein [Lachnellula hyalina]
MSQTQTMKAVVYQEPFKVSIEERPVPELEHPDDALIKITTAAICGSDLHMYQGRTAAQGGLCFGHENMGIVIETGTGVSLLQKGDRVVMPFNVADGRCRNCEEGKTAFCTGVNPGFAGGAYGYVAMGPYQGGQAQFIRVPYADFNCLPLPAGTEHESDFIMLADIFPTGWHGVEISGFQPGESIAVFGAGPVGLMAAYSAVLRGASQVYVVDCVRERLAAAEKIGCVAVDFSKVDAVPFIVEKNGGMVDRSVDAVGYQASAVDGKKEAPSIVLENCIMVTRPTGGIGVPGLYVPSDPGAPDSNSGSGKLLISFGKLFEKGLTIGTGQCNVKTYNRYLRDMIISGRAKPSFVVSHEIGIDEAPGAYVKFDKREDGYTKVLIHPNGPVA